MHELARSWVFDVDYVTAKAFKPLPEVAPIGERCILRDARLLVPISEAQVAEFALSEEQLARRGAAPCGSSLIYFSAPIAPSRGASTRKLVCRESARTSRL